jgi:CheY-like chemotaxis protein
MKRKLNCVLLIDDDEPTNFLNRMLIEEAHCSEYIEVKQSGQDALNYLKESEHFGAGNKNFPFPDLIFLDINMPAMNGWESVIVMLTTSLDPEDEVKAKKIAGVTDFKHKPLTKKIVDEILDTYFAGHFSER